MPPFFSKHYLVTHCLQRLIIQRVVTAVLLAFSTHFGLASNKPTVPLSYEDSVFMTLNTSQKYSSLITLSLDQVEDTLIAKHVQALNKEFPLGGIILKRGSSSHLHQWIMKLKKSSAFPPFIGLSLTSPYSMPIEGLIPIATSKQLQCITDNDLLYEAGKYLGTQFQALGIDMLMIENHGFLSSPNAYLSGLKSAGLKLALGPKQSTQDVEQLQPFDILFADILPISTSTKSKFKDIAQAFRQTTGLNRVMWVEINPNDGIDSKEIASKINGGAQMIVAPLQMGSTRSFLQNWTISGKRIKKKVLAKRVKRVIKGARSYANQKTPSYQPTIPFDSLVHSSHIQSVVLLKNDKGIVPLKNIDGISIATLTWQSDVSDILKKYLDFYARATHFGFTDIWTERHKFLQSLGHFDQVIVMLPPDLTLEVKMETTSFLNELSQVTEVIILGSGSNELASNYDAFNTVLWTPEYSPYYSGILPQSLFGAESISGAITTDTTETIGLSSVSIGRLKYAPASVFNIDREKLREIDILIKDAIETGAIPGCQVLLAKSGTVIFNKSYGYLTYDSLNEVSDESIYDIASITKVVATVPAVMFLADWNKLKVTQSLSELDEFYVGSNKSDLKIKDLLMHQAGLQSYLPFWRNAETGKNGNDFLFKVPRRKRRKYGKQFIQVNWNDSIKHWIEKSRFIEKETGNQTYPYYYSDLGFMLLKDLSETKLNQSIDVFLRQNLLDPLGMTNTYYHPLCQFPIHQIAPTEDDDYFRNSQVWGTVHDQNAAITGGIAGHAGLFSNANDLAKYLQMFLQKGYYGGLQFFKPETIDLFTKRHSKNNRRGLGWDKPDYSIGNSSKYSSSNSFGHTGFTGTSFWADPEHEMIYVFLSNRIYPNIENIKLIQNNIRTTIHDLMYEALNAADTSNHN